MMDPEQLYIDGRLWGAKDHKFWCLLSSLLIKCKPISILEIGSGRSTTFFADYAATENVPFLSIEESPHWYAEIYRDLRFMLLSGKYIKHIPINHITNWYDKELFENITDQAGYDLVMIDGPSGVGMRGPLPDNGLDKLLQNSRMIIIDDTHRDDCRKFAEHITTKLQFTYSITIPYKQRLRGKNHDIRYGENTVTILTSQWSDIVSSQITNIYGP